MTDKVGDLDNMANQVYLKTSPRQTVVLAGLLSFVVGSGVHLYHEFNSKPYVVNAKEDTVSGNVRIEITSDGPLGYGVRSQTYEFRNTDSPFSFPLHSHSVSYYDSLLTPIPLGVMPTGESNDLFLFQLSTDLLSDTELERMQDLYKSIKP